MTVSPLVHTLARYRLMFFFFNDTATTEIYTLSLHDALPIFPASEVGKIAKGPRPKGNGSRVDTLKGGDYVRVWIAKGGNNYIIDRKSTRLNSSHGYISYAVFCLKKKKIN